MFFSSWENLGQILLVGFFSYLALLVILRFSGNRTLSQMNSFDFIITVAMGSTFSTGMLDKDLSVLDTVGALLLLIMMQYSITRLTLKSKFVDKVVKPSPVILYQNDQFKMSQMIKERITEDEVLASVRECGISTLSQVEAVVLETNGKISAIPKQISSTSELHGTKSYEDIRP